MSTSSTMRLAAVLAMLSGAALPLHARDAGHDRFDPQQTFAPYAYPAAANAMRDASGKPGPLFWQNRADYAIQASLDPATRKLSGSETITYTNHSPDALEVIWLQVEQNRYRRDARGAFGGDSFPTEFTDGEHIRSVEVEDASGHRRKAAWTISDTRMQVTLPTPLKAHDGQLRLHIVWDYTVPGEFGGRTDWNANRQGDIFEMAQWYPRVCVYDDLRGWDTQPFLNSEFYLEYGDFDYRVTVPSDMIVVGSGELLNPQDVLTKAQRERLDKARHSDATVAIRSAAEVADPASRPKQGGTLTWHFAMKNTRDVAFGASKAFIWDAARMNLPGGKTALAMSAYPVESAGDAAWGSATQDLKKSVEFFSKTYLPYPYPVAINEAGASVPLEVSGIMAMLFVLVALVAAFVILILFEPVRSWLENGINRWLLRQRTELRLVVEGDDLRRRGDGGRGRIFGQGRCDRRGQSEEEGGKQEADKGGHGGWFRRGRAARLPAIIARRTAPAYRPIGNFIAQTGAGRGRIIHCSGLHLERRGAAAAGAFRL